MATRDLLAHLKSLRTVPSVTRRREISHLEMRNLDLDGQAHHLEKTKTGESRDAHLHPRPSQDLPDGS